MRSGRLDKTITIEQKVPSRTSSGQETVTWETYATLRAYKSTQRGQEYLSGDKKQAEADVMFLARYKSGIDYEMRVVCEGLIYDIVAIIEVGRGRALEIAAKIQVG